MRQRQKKRKMPLKRRSRSQNQSLSKSGKGAFTSIQISKHHLQVTGTVLLAGVTSGRCPSGTSSSISCKIRNQLKDLIQRMRSHRQQHQLRISPSNSDPWRILTLGYLLLLGTSIATLKDADWTPTSTQCLFTGTSNGGFLDVVDGRSYSDILCRFEALYCIVQLRCSAICKNGNNWLRCRPH